MNKKFKTAIIWFRRDLRLADNTALNQALEQSDVVYPCFVFNPQQLESNPHRSDSVIQFMLTSLGELDLALKEKGSSLNCFYGEPGEVFSEIFANNKIDAIFLNKDYTPFAQKRDRTVSEVAEKQNAAFGSTHDLLLIEPDNALKSDGSPYTVYTPFFKNASKQVVRKCTTETQNTFSKTKLKGAKNIQEITLDFEPNSQLAAKGGRSEALAVLENISRYKDYEATRDFPALSTTTKLSAHHKFGTVSIREVYHQVSKKLGSNHCLIKELYWRDFFTHIARHFPHVFKGAFHKRYDKLEWENNQEWFKAWCDGRTGFPIVDAGMRELNATGFMHNRVRMIVASFLTKDLIIDWRWGERYFAQKLVDYDPAVNNGNWQWAASTGCDAQPYFRIFNPWLQQKKFDAECEYIKRWIPELKDLSPKQIHSLHQEEQNLFSANYPPPIVDHREQKEIAEDLYVNL